MPASCKSILLRDFAISQGSCNSFPFDRCGDMIRNSFVLKLGLSLAFLLHVQVGQRTFDSLAQAGELPAGRPAGSARRFAEINERRSVEQIISIRSRYHSVSRKPIPGLAGHARFTPLRKSDLLRPANGGTLRPSSAGSGGFPVKTGLSDSIQQQWLTSYTSGLAASEDEAVAIARDPSGNLYVSGFSDSSVTGNDIVTIKFNSAGVKQWTTRYNGPADGDDRPSKIVIDSAGNVYLCGHSAGAGTGYDYVTLKYNPSGIQQWVARYNGTANGNDYATALAPDGQGNIYVTGYSAGPGTGYNYVTVKYNSAGGEQKVFRYNGAGNGDDFAVAIGTDKKNAVYVTGYSASAGSGKDYTTIKYDATGNQRWVVSYNGTGNGDDYAAGLGIDNSANVYVTGTARGAGTGDDFATIKYDSAGAQKWVATYNGPASGADQASAIAVDGAGTAYVAGSSRGVGTGYDFAAVKYTTGGLQSWVARYDGAFSGDEFASAIAFDPSGSVYVTGSSSDETAVFFNEVTVMYNSVGFLQWAARYKSSQSNDSHPTAIVNDGAGSVIVAGYSDLEEGNAYDYSAVCYSITGSQLWDARYNGPGISDDAPRAVVTDITGNIYVAGYSRSSVSGYDFLTVKFNASGVQQWAQRYDGPSRGDDIVTAMAADPAGNVYVSGYSYDSSGTTSEYATVKYNSAGARQWVARNSGLLESTNFALGLAVSNTGSVFVTGTSGDSSGAAYDYLTIKYNGNGAEQWEARFNGSMNGGDFAVAVAVDSFGSAYVTGATDESSNKGYDYGTVKYGANGAQLWSVRYNGPASDDDNGSAIAVDGSGNVDVTGSSLGATTSYDYATVQYNSSGSQQWVRRYNGSANSDDTPAAMVLDATGNVYVGGYGTNTGTASDYATVAYTSHGTQRWVALYNGPAGGNDQATGIAVGADGSVYVTGSSDGGGTLRDYATLKYDSLGNQQWSARYNGTPSGNDDGAGIAVDQAGGIIVTGSSGFGLPGDPSSGSTFTTIKYHQLLPGFALSRTSMNFGTVNIGCRSTDTVKISNAGLAPLQIASAISDNPAFLVSPSSLTVGPNGNAVVSVTFAPSTGSVQSGRVVFLHNAPGSPDTVTVTGNSTDSVAGISITLSLGAGWQLISLPVRAACPYVLDRLYAYQSGYTRHDTMANGMGYWKKLDGTSLSFTGFAIGPDTVQVSAEWNIVGSVSQPVAAASITTMPAGIIRSPLFGYEGSYTIADTIVPGHGYWVRTSASGSFLFQPQQAIPRRQSDREFLENLDQAGFVDAAGRSRILYFGRTGRENVSPDYFQLPPLPPGGAFDARFSNGSMVALLGTEERREIPVKISGAQFPLTFVCSRKGGNPAAWLRAGGRKIPLRGTVKVLLEERDTPILLGLEGAPEVPSRFNLAQNYPNPFNPVTIVRYSLPVRSRVRLEIYDLLGRKLKTLVDAEEEAGFRSTEWDATDGTGVPASSGIYFCRMEAWSAISTGTHSSQVRSMLLVR